MLSTCGLYIATNTCIYADAVYLYLLTLNQTLAEGNLDYRDGRLVRSRTIGQRFVGTQREYLSMCIDCTIS